MKHTISQAGKVALSVLDAIVLSASRIIPLDTEPDALCAVNRTHKSDGSQEA